MGNKARGILLASAPSVLASLFFNRSKRKMQARFGTGLTALHMVPISKDGMTFLCHIMKDNLVNYRRSHAEPTGKCSENEAGK